MVGGVAAGVDFTAGGGYEPDLPRHELSQRRSEAFEVPDMVQHRRAPAAAVQLDDLDRSQLDTPLVARQMVYHRADNAAVCDHERRRCDV